MLRACRYRRNPVDDYLAKLGISQEIITFVKNLADSKIQGKIVNELRKNKNLALAEIKDLAESFGPKEITWDYDEENILNIYRYNNVDSDFYHWLKTQLLKYRTGKIVEFVDETYLIHKFPIVIPETNEIKYLDFENCANFRGLHFDNLINEIYDWYEDKKPKIASYDFVQAQKETLQWHKDILTKHNKYDPIDKDLIQFVYPDNWFIIKITSAHDLEVEGNLMHNCVGAYYQFVKTKERRIFSLRDDENMPHVTINLSRDTEGQYFAREIRGYGNSDPKLTYKKRIGQWLKTLDWLKENRRIINFIRLELNQIDNRFLKDYDLFKGKNIDSKQYGDLIVELEEYYYEILDRCKNLQYLCSDTLELSDLINIDLSYEIVKDNHNYERIKNEIRLKCIKKVNKKLKELGIGVSD